MTDRGAPLVVVTKLVRPRVLAESITRKRVTRLLDAAARRRLIVLCAPAGYGKTTALVEWLDCTDGPSAWVSLDARDDEPLRLCAHVLAALDRALPGTMDGATRALLAGADLIDTVVPLTVNALAEHTDGELVLALDDYHLVKRESCHRLLIDLIDAAPPDVHIVVSSRTAPPLRLARRRAAGTVEEIGPPQLAFQEAESGLLLNGSLGLGLTPEQLATIHERVDGWPAGLSLIASSLVGRTEPEEFLEAFTGSSGKLAEYLVEEVLEAADPAIRDFLFRTSILGRLSAPLCEAVLDDPSAGERLAEVRRSNLFVTEVDPDGDWVRYHQLFAALLERELKRRSPELVAVLHLRASAWFEANEPPDEAISHASAAGDGERAARLLHAHWRAFMAERRYVTLRTMIAQLPSERGELAGFCAALDTLCMAVEGGDPRLVAERLDALEPLRDEPDVAAIVDVLRIGPFYGDVGRAVQAAWSVWERDAAEPLGRASIAGQFAAVMWFAGDRAAVHHLVEPLVDMIESPAGRGWALAALALTAVDEGDVDLAESYAREAVELAVCDGAESPPESHLPRVALAEALRLRGDLVQARAAITPAVQSTAKQPGSVYRAFALTYLAQLDLASRDRRRARSRAAAARRIVDRYPDVGTLAERLATVEAALERRSDDALLGSRPTPAELRLLELLPSDLTLKAIATEHLFVSIHTVTSHAQRLYRRLGARTRAEAVAAARERGLL